MAPDPLVVAQPFRAAVAALALTLLAAIGSSAQQREQRSIWDGVYTETQAKRGEKIYADSCAGCHGADLAGVGIIAALEGSGFLKSWEGKTVGDLFERQRTTMPTDDPKKLTAEQHADVLAYVLKMNKFPAGASELPRETKALGAIAIELKSSKK